jgi:predicted nucleic acid-binding protein
VILADTGPLVALCDPHDRKHADAAGDFERLGSEKFAICEAVLVESHFHLRAASARERLWDLLRELDVELLGGRADPGFLEAVFVWLHKYRDQEPDWADASIAVLVGSDDTLRVWTYDTEFRTKWRKPNGRAIPLVRQTE